MAVLVNTLCLAFCVINSNKQQHATVRQPIYIRCCPQICSLRHGPVGYLERRRNGYTLVVLNTDGSAEGQRTYSLGRGLRCPSSALTRVSCRCFTRWPPRFRFVDHFERLACNDSSRHKSLLRPTLCIKKFSRKRSISSSFPHSEAFTRHLVTVLAKVRQIENQRLHRFV